MEAIFIWFALAIGLFYLLCPIIAWVTARNAHARIALLERQLEELQASVRHLSRAESPVLTPAAEEAASAETPVAPPRENPDLAPSLPALPASVFPTAVSSTPIVAEPRPATVSASVDTAETPDAAAPDPWFAETAPPPQHSPSPPPAWLVQAKAWLLGGNLVTKLALLILFLGVSFFVKYAAARVSVPIEWRLLGIVMADLALLAWAWQIRAQRRAVSLPVQGTAIAILMLVTFGAYRIYGLIPGGLAFALLFALTGFTVLLAVLQDALWLAVFGIAGGFAAPVLTTTGGGSHIGLFGYYALLNAGILTVALYRSWRLLNWVGFIFTFVIGTAWGVLRYNPENYLSVQLFLLLFFAFYVSIAILYAQQQALKLTHYVDGTMVFGTPLVGFGLQYGLVKDTPFGLAFSALTLGLVYSGLAVLLWRRRGTNLTLLVESFLALGIVFGTLAIPFALSGRWTSAAWALEGAGMVWVGLRQRQTLAWLFGLLVQCGAWVSFMGGWAGLDAAVALNAHLWLGFLLLAATALLMAVSFRQQARTANDAMAQRYAGLSAVFLIVATLWLLSGAWTEILLRTDGSWQATGVSFTGLVVAASLAVIAQRLDWPLAKGLALVVQIAVGLVFVLLLLANAGTGGDTGQSLWDGPFLGGLLIATAALVSALALHRQGAAFAKLSNRLLAWACVWWYLSVLNPWADWLQQHYRLARDLGAERSDDLLGSFYALGAVLSAWGFVWLTRRLDWQPLRWAGVSVWLLQGFTGLMLLSLAYFDQPLPPWENWLAYALLWAAGEWLLAYWPAQAWPISPFWLRTLHTLRTAGPWLMIWPVGHGWLAAWLNPPPPTGDVLLASADGSWSRYLPVWAMLGGVFWVTRQTRLGRWPAYPVQDWYRRWLIPLGTGWAWLLAAMWNLSQDGRMEPLPYLPVLNPLDLTTGLVLLLGLASYRLARTGEGDTLPAWMMDKALWAAAVSAYLWFNLMLMRTVAAYANMPYDLAALWDVQFVQTLLSLLWSITALGLMWWAARRGYRKVWLAGSALLGLVVAKLFLVDLSNVGGLERVISFIGVGLLMLAIGYLAPYPAEAATARPPPPG